jgi:hypothetical protein
VAGVLIVAGGVTGVLLATGGDDHKPKRKEERKVDVSPAAIDSRYDALASKMSSGTSDCKAPKPAAGEKEVVDCTVPGGTLHLVTYTDESALATARRARLDYKAGTLIADSGSTALYEYDPSQAGTSDSALIYWDSKAGPQSATITSNGGTELKGIKPLYTATSPRVSEPTNPEHSVLRDFVNINMDVSRCSRQPTFFDGETEESSCESGVDGVVVTVGRFNSRKGLRDQRKYYKGQYGKADTKGGGPTWNYVDGPVEGAYYAYLQDDTATVYWDWNKADCNCYAVAWNFSGDLQKVEKWWPAE